MFTMHGQRSLYGIALLVIVFAIALGFTATSVVPATQEVADVGEMCVWETVSVSSVAATPEDGNLFAAFADQPVLAASQESTTGEVVRQPARNILDTDPIYSAVTVDVPRDEVYLQDPNTWSIRVFGRLDNTPTDAPRTEPRRVIGGPKTDVQFNSCVYVDPKNGEIYSVENDIGDSIVVFKNNANGDAEPVRKLSVTHRAYAMAVDEEKDELYLSVQYPPQVAVYRKQASGNEKPKRLIIGESTR